MYAIFLTGGKQLKASVGETLYIEKIEGEEGDEVEFDQVLYVENDDQQSIGHPFVEGAKIKAKIVKHGKERKIHVLRYHAKSNVRVRRGHRQPYTAVCIEAISIA